MKFLLLAVVILCLSCFSGCFIIVASQQQEDYVAIFKPTTCGNAKCTVTPFFSPDHSMDAYLMLINNAKETIDLLVPGFISWSGCTDSNGGNQECVGCTLEDQLNEELPVFSALVNAANIRGVKVRVVINGPSPPAPPVCADRITPIEWMKLVGIDLRYYTTTTSLKASFLTIDNGANVLVSSADFTKTSFIPNREAGVIVSDCSSCKGIQFYGKVFNYDFNKAFEHTLTRNYTTEEVEYVQRSAELPRVSETAAVPVTMASINDVKIRLVYATPDNARNTLLQILKAATKSIKVHMYMITDIEICDQLLVMSQNGILVKLLVSGDVADKEDFKQAQQCYQNLYTNGMDNGVIQNTDSVKFRFSHQKYWIIDDSMVHLSTGDWTPSDFPEGDTFKPYSISGVQVNRNFLLAMESPDLVANYIAVFNEDWNSGSPWTHMAASMQLQDDLGGKDDLPSQQKQTYCTAESGADCEQNLDIMDTASL